MSLDKVQTVVEDGDVYVKILVGLTVVNFRTENAVANLLEGKAFVQIQTPGTTTSEIPYHFKLSSDTNREVWARILGKAFDSVDTMHDKLHWPLLVNQACSEIENVLLSQKQHLELDEIEAKDTTWLLEPFIQEDQINTFFGLGASGKTMLSLYFSSLTPGRVLFIDYENDSQSWAAKIRKMDVDPKKFVYFDSLQIPLYDQVDKIKGVISECDIKLVVVDSASLASGDSTSDEKAALKMFAGLKLLKTTVLLIAHQRKNEGDKNPIGSIQYENQARNVWNVFIDRESPIENELRVGMKHTKANNTFVRKKPFAFSVKFGDRYTVEKAEAMETFESKFNLVDRIENLLREGPLNAKDIAAGLNATIGTVRVILTRWKGKRFTNDDSGFWSNTTN